ncbi:hypothetical protein [Frankia sp. CcI49]|uniref:hypothetical protein n=1 Tax=Frankia sp. CcI49 TaxID=1745382 RepID=UPI0018E90D61|nr:hypothetical protein [Frankia sp. CcI49]
MVTLGVDAHKRTHTIVVVDDHGRKLAERTIGTVTKDHLGLLRWARTLGDGRRSGRSRTAGICLDGWSGTC